MSTNRPSAPDPLVLKCFRVSMPFVRAWLYRRGYNEAAAALANITYEDAEDAFEYIREDAQRPDARDAFRVSVLKCVLEGGPHSPGSILPTLAEARER